MASYRKRGDKYLVTWRADGRQKAKSVGSKREAEGLVRKLEGRELHHSISLAKGGITVWAGAGQTDRYGRLTLSGYGERFLAEHGYRSEEGRRYASDAIRKYLGPGFDGKALESVTVSDVKVWVRKMEASSNRPTVEKVCSVGSSIWRDAIEVGLIPEGTVIPFRIDRKRLKPHDKRPRYILTPEDFRLVHDTIDRGSRRSPGCRPMGRSWRIPRVTWHMATCDRSIDQYDPPLPVREMR